MNDFLDRVHLAPDQTEDGQDIRPASKMPSLINQLMMGAHAWMQLARRVPHQGNALYKERAKRADEYWQRAERIRYWIARAKTFRDNPNVPINDMSGPMICSILEIICGP